MLMRTQVNNSKICPKIDELKDLCPLELMLISQIISFMFIFAKFEDAQHGLKSQYVLVPAKCKGFYLKSCDEEYLMSLVLKHRLTW